MELAERPLGALVVRLDEAFDDDFGSGGERQPGLLAFHYRDWLLEDRADVVPLAHAERNLDARDEVAERVAAEHDRHREALARGLVLLVVDAAVLARHHVERDVVAVEQLHAVGADVDPVRVEVARDDRAAGTDVAPAVHLVPERRRETSAGRPRRLSGCFRRRSGSTTNRSYFGASACHCAGLPRSASTSPLCVFCIGRRRIDDSRAGLLVLQVSTRKPFG